MMDFVELFFLIFFLCTCLHFLLQLSRSSKLPPGPLPLPIVGSLFLLGSRPNESLARLGRKHGALMTVKLGSLTTVVVSNADMAHQVLKKHDQVFSGRTVPDSIRALNHHESSLAWSPPNALWRKLRTLCNTEMLTTRRLDASRGLRGAKVKELLAHVYDCCMAGREVGIGRAGFVTTLNLISSTVFSVDLVGARSEESSSELKEIVWGIMEEGARPSVVDWFPMLRWLDPRAVRRRMAKHIGKLHQLFDGMIQQRLLSRSLGETRREDFLDVILDSEDNGFKLTSQEIKALLTDIFVAGSDTTSNTIEWAMAELLRNPVAMARARSELKETIAKDKQVEESDIARLPYLQAVVKETLRLHPPIPLLLPHRAESTVQVCGFTIPKHTQVIVNAWAIGRDPDVWSNPGSFLPQRFLGAKTDFRGQDFQFIPFGAGRRICPGLPLATRMVHLMLASLLNSFAWKLPDGISPGEMNMGAKFGISLQMEVPLRAVPLQD